MTNAKRAQRNQKIISAYNNGNRIADIAKKYGLATPTVQTIISDGRARGLVTREPRRTTHTSPARIASVVERYQAGETLAQIGNSLGVTRERIRQILEEAGIDRRSRSSYFDDLYQRFVDDHGTELNRLFDDIRSISGVIDARPELPAASIRRFLQPRLNEVVRSAAHTKIWTNDDILGVLKMAARRRSTITIPQYNAWRNDGNLYEGRRPVTVAIIQWRFGSWRDALTAAGLEATPVHRTYNRKWTKDDALNAVRTFAQSTLASGQRPTYFAYTQWAKSNPGNPSGPYVRYLVGSTWSDALKKALVTQ